MTSPANNGGGEGTPAGKEGASKPKAEEERRSGEEEEWGSRRVSMEKGESSIERERDDAAGEGLMETVFGKEEERRIKEWSTEKEGEAKGKECEGEKEIEEEGGEPAADRGEEVKPEKDSGKEEKGKGLRGRGGVAVALWKENSHGGEERTREGD